MKKQKKDFYITVQERELRSFSERLAEPEIGSLTSRVLCGKEETGNCHGRDPWGESRKIRPRWQIVLAACLMLAIVVPAGAYAADKITSYFKYTIQKSRNLAETDLLPVSTEDKATSTVPYVRIACNFSGDFMEERELYGDDAESSFTDGCYTYSNQSLPEGEYQFLQMQLIYVDIDQKEQLFQSNVEKQETLEINGHQAVYTQEYPVIDSDNDETKKMHLYVFYDEYGYLMDITSYTNNYGCKTKTEFLEIAGGLTLEEGTKKNHDSYLLLSEELKYGYGEAIEPYKGYTEPGYNTIEEALQVEKAVSMGDAIELWNLSYQLTNAEILDSVAGLTEGILSGKTKLYGKNGLSNEDGTLKTYLREKVKYSDGVKEPSAKVVEKEKVQPRVLYLTFQIKNATKEEHAVALGGPWRLEKRKGKYYNLRIDGSWAKVEENGEVFTYSYPQYIEQARADFFYCDGFERQEHKDGDYDYMVPAKSKRTVHVAYLLDEDEMVPDLSNMYVRIGASYAISLFQ